MSEDIGHECGVAALYWLNEPIGRPGPATAMVQENNVASLIPSMLLDLQNRGQLAAGMSSYNPARAQILDTYKSVGTVSEVFRMSHPGKYRAILDEYSGPAAIGHTRYATCGADDARFAQPFERHHGRLWKWFCFAFNGNLANYNQLRARLVNRRRYHFTLNTDTEIIMHMLAYSLRGDRPIGLRRAMANISTLFDGAYNLVFLDGLGRMFVSRDPHGIRPMSWAVQGKLFAAASESVALTNMGFENVQSLRPGEMAIIENGKLNFVQYERPKRRSHCFFEWVYFSNVASQIDGSSVYVARARSGERLAEMEDQPLGSECVVVPVPDTAKAAADAFAYRLGVPCVEGLIRNRYVGRTFIQPQSTRGFSARSKYTPLPAVLAGKRVFLIEDSIVRSTTLTALAHRIRQVGKAREVHVRVACPPIIAPCFYGIDMSTLGELFAPQFLNGKKPGAAAFAEMSKRLGVDSLKYLPVEELGPCLQMSQDDLCTGCVTGHYPSTWGNRLMRCARRNASAGKDGRTYE